MKKVISKLIIPLFLILLTCSVSTNAENVIFERSIDDITIDFNLDYIKYLKNNEETMLHTRIFVINYPADMTVCFFISIAFFLFTLDSEAAPYHAEFFTYSHNFMNNPEFILSATFTPDANSSESPDDYFANCFISLSFEFIIGYDGPSESQEILSPNLLLYTLVNPTSPSDTGTETDPLSSGSPSSLESFFNNYGLAVVTGGIIAVVVGILVLLSKSTPTDLSVSTHHSQEFTKKRSSEKKSRRDRKRKN